MDKIGKLYVGHRFWLFTSNFSTWRQKLKFDVKDSGYKLVRSNYLPSKCRGRLLVFSVWGSFQSVCIPFCSPFLSLFLWAAAVWHKFSPLQSDIDWVMSQKCLCGILLSNVVHYWQFGSFSPVLHSSHLADIFEKIRSVIWKSCTQKLVFTIHGNMSNFSSNHNWQQ